MRDESRYPDEVHGTIDWPARYHSFATASSRSGQNNNSFYPTRLVISYYNMENDSLYLEGGYRAIDYQDITS